MKKDKKWAQREVDRYLSYEGVNEARNALMFAKGVISQLEEPETLNEEWINEHSKCYTMENTVEISDLKNLLLPQPKKPVIPKFVADWIEVSKKHYRIGAVFHDAYDGKLAKVAIEEYIFENQDLFAQAWLDGYEVEKEKLYYLRLRDEDLPLYKAYDMKSFKYKLVYSAHHLRNENFLTVTFSESEIENMDIRSFELEEVTE